MTTAFDYADTAQRAESAVAATLDTWKRGVTAVTDQLRTLPSGRSLPRVEVTEVVERQFALIQQVVDLNHGYARKLAEVADTFTGATRDQIRSVSEVARAGVDTVERTVREQFDQAEKAKPQQAEEVHDTAREFYGSLTEAELSTVAGKRGLPTSGTVEELIERLVTDDTK